MPSFWTTQLFKDELAALVDHLGIAGRYHVLGQSWGGMLAMDHALDQPPGLLSVVAADSPANADAFARGAVALLDTLPPETKATILRHEEAGTTDDPEYAAAVQEFYTRYVCRLDPWPDALVASFDAMEADPTVYGTLNGPSEFTVSARCASGTSPTASARSTSRCCSSRASTTRSGPRSSG